jgi:flagellar hook-length control protein FliK
MILTSLCRQATPEAKPLPGNIGRDAGPAMDEAGKDRDASDEFDALVAALAGPVPACAPATSATVEAGGEASTIPAGTGKAAPAPPEVQIAAGGATDLAIVPDLAARPARRDAFAESAAIDITARQSADSQPIARGSATVTDWTGGSAGVPRQGGDGADPLPVGPSDRASAAAPLRVMVHASANPAAASAPDATGPVPDAPDTGNTAPTVEAAGETPAEADGGEEPPEAGTGADADASARQKPTGPESGTPLSVASQSPARSETESRGLPAPTTDPADPSSRQDPASVAIAKAVHHLAEAGHRKGSGTVEIALSPEELGHLRLTIKTHEGGAVYVHLSADRQDTLDLMRRHVELLAQDMRDLGYGDLNFSFQDKAQRAPPDFWQSDQPGAGSEAPHGDPGHGAAQAVLRTAFADSGLDIRI